MLTSVFLSIIWYCIGKRRARVHNLRWRANLSENNGSPLHGLCCLEIGIRPQPAANIPCLQARTFDNLRHVLAFLDPLHLSQPVTHHITPSNNVSHTAATHSPFILFRRYTNPLLLLLLLQPAISLNPYRY